MEEGPFAPPPLGSETTEAIHQKFGVFDYDHCSTTHAKYGCHREGGEVGWEMGEVVRTLACMLFYFLFLERTYNPA